MSMHRLRAQSDEILNTRDMFEVSVFPHLIRGQAYPDGRRVEIIEQESVVGGLSDDGETKT
jgi:hypothetical protein